MKKAFLSGLGVMGRRHLKGLIRAGFNVVAYDPSATSAKIAEDELAAENLSTSAWQWVLDIPKGAFDIALFAETANHRFKNVNAFVSQAHAAKYLLEKPLSSDPSEVVAFLKLFEQAGVSHEVVCVNFVRRTWNYVRQIKRLCEDASEFHLTVNGGAFGFACNGIHYLDLYLYFNKGELPKIQYVHLCESAVASGRGPDFSDFGGCFLLETSRSTFFCSGSSNSSAPVVMTVSGDHFVAWIDENDRLWRLRSRDPKSDVPNYRRGVDYHTDAEGIASVLSFEQLTERWALGKEALPTINESLTAHVLLNDILRAGGAIPPYCYT